MGPIFRRAIRAALFDRRAFDDVSWDRSATADAVVLVAAVSVVVSVVSGIRFGLANLVSIVLSSLIADVAGWLFLAVATWLAGTRLFLPAADPRRGFEHAQTLMRVQGVAYLPVVLAAVPGGGVALAAGTIGLLWYLGAASVGTAVALGVRTWEGALSVLIGAAGLYLLGLVAQAPFALFSAL